MKRIIVKMIFVILVTTVSSIWAEENEMYRLKSDIFLKINNSMEAQELESIFIPDIYGIKRKQHLKLTWENIAKDMENLKMSQSFFKYSDNTSEKTDLNSKSSNPDKSEVAKPRIKGKIKGTLIGTGVGLVIGGMLYYVVRVASALGGHSDSPPVGIILVPTIYIGALGYVIGDYYDTK